MHQKYQLQRSPPRSFPRSFPKIHIIKSPFKKQLQSPQLLNPNKINLKNCRLQDHPPKYEKLPERYINKNKNENIRSDERKQDPKITKTYPVQSTREYYALSKSNDEYPSRLCAACGVGSSDGGKAGNSVGGGAGVEGSGGGAGVGRKGGGAGVEGREVCAASSMSDAGCGASFLECRTSASASIFSAFNRRNSSRSSRSAAGVQLRNSSSQSFWSL